MSATKASATKILGECYSGFGSLTRNIYFFPYTATNAVIVGCRANANYNKMNSVYGNDDRSMEFGKGVVSAFEAQQFASRVMFWLTPLLVPLTIVTFALALALDIAALVSKIITYPIAMAVDAVDAPSPSF